MRKTSKKGIKSEMSDKNLKLYARHQFQSKQEKAVNNYLNEFSGIPAKKLWETDTYLH